jgi:hypothetical protein
MKRSRRFAALCAIGFVSGAAFVAACSFPELHFVDDGAEGGPEGSTGEAGTDAPADAVDDSVDPNGKDAEAGVLTDAGGIDANSVDAACCDCDGDGFLNDKPACQAEAGKVDCDDFNANINPGVNKFIQNPWPGSSWPHAGDWNCDGVVSKQLDYNLKCSGAVPSCSSAGATTSHTEGFSDDITCGDTANYFACGGLGSLLCNGLKANGQQTQACK